ncbi:MAG: hypothetical protein OEZ19_07700 [Paracoccaceae bacterium]|nr:hypothetical protein [Paracoccaceae bacterium]
MELTNFILPSNAEEVIKETLDKLGKWRAFVVALDGRSGLGKSVFGRYLSYKMEIPLIELDIFKDRNGIYSHLPALSELVKNRLDRQKPVLVEGICCGQILLDNEISCDWVIRLKHENYVGPERFRKDCEEYEVKFSPDIVADSRYNGE